MASRTNVRLEDAATLHLEFARRLVEYNKKPKDQRNDAEFEGETLFLNGKELTFGTKIHAPGIANLGLFHGQYESDDVFVKFVKTSWIRNKEVMEKVFAVENDSPNVAGCYALVDIGLNITVEVFEYIEGVNLETLASEVALARKNGTLEQYPIPYIVWTAFNSLYTLHCRGLETEKELRNFMVSKDNYAVFAVDMDSFNPVPEEYIPKDREKRAQFYFSDAWVLYAQMTASPALIPRLADNVEAEQKELRSRLKEGGFTLWTRGNDVRSGINLYPGDDWWDMGDEPHRYTKYYSYASGRLPKHQEPSERVVTGSSWQLR